ncbi:MAG: hypothetical protein AAFZ67_04925 [Planctomycetota bacterium]
MMPSIPPPSIESIRIPGAASVGMVVPLSSVALVARAAFFVVFFADFFAMIIPAGVPQRHPGRNTPGRVGRRLA